MSDSSPPTDSKIRDEHSEAIACYERTLFFARCGQNNMPLPPFDGHPYYWKYAAGYYRHDLPEEPYLAIIHISTVYSDSFRILFKRLAHVRGEYLDLRRCAKLEKVPLIDREFAAVEESQEVVATSFFHLEEELKSRASAAREMSSIEFDLYKRGFLGLRKKCNLLMEEISYLDGRVHAILGLLSTKSSLRLAILGIWISTIAAAIGLVFVIKEHFWDSARDRGALESAYHMELGKSHQKSDDLRKYLEKIKKH